VREHHLQILRRSLVVALSHHADGGLIRNDQKFVDALGEDEAERRCGDHGAERDHQARAQFR
jgi:hypothetical protein